MYRHYIGECRTPLGLMTGPKLPPSLALGSDNARTVSKQTQSANDRKIQYLGTFELVKLSALEDLPTAS